MIVFFHGLIGGPEHWDDVCADLRGKAPILCDRVSDYLRDDVCDIARRFAPVVRQAEGPVVLVGNSLGCMVALKLVHLADRVVLTGPPFDFGKGSIPLRKSQIAPYVAALHSRATIRREAHFAQDAQARLEALLSSRQAIRRVRKLKTQAEDFLTGMDLAAAQDKCNIVLGADDFTTPVGSFSAFLAREAPSARLHVWRNCGYAIPLEHPARLAALIAKSYGARTVPSHADDASAVAAS